MTNIVFKEIDRSNKTYKPGDWFLSKGVLHVLIQTGPNIVELIRIHYYHANGFDGNTSLVNEINKIPARIITSLFKNENWEPVEVEITVTPKP